MPVRLAILLLMLGLTVWAMPARAFLDPPYITPANPTAGDLVSVNIYGGGCDLVDDGVVWPPPVTQHGNELAILLTGGHEEDPEFCDPGAGTYTFPIGIYPSGTYSLRVDWRYSTFSGWLTETLGVIPFTVTSASLAQPIPTPTLSVTGLASFLLMLVATASIDLRRRARLLC